MKNLKHIKIAIIKSNYYPDLTQSLEKACRKYLVDCGIKVDNLQTFDVPGSWEIPLIAKNIAGSGKFDGIIALGVIIKGETYHFEILARECSRALMNLALEFNIPIVFEILTAYNLKQAQKRSFGKYNKGVEAAQTLLKTYETLKLCQ